LSFLQLFWNSAFAHIFIYFLAILLRKINFGFGENKFWIQEKKDNTATIAKTYTQNKSHKIEKNKIS